VLHISCRFIF
jgi:hypothetical protein